MTSWSIWEEISGIMAVLCLVTALAAIAAAAILLVHEKLTDRLHSMFRSGTGRKTGILVLVAAGVWILVIGRSVSAAEAPETDCNTGGVKESAEISSGGSTGKDPETASSGSTSREIAPEVEPDPDVRAPSVTVQMAQEVRKDESGRIYCRADNAGIRVRFADDRKDDLGIVSYKIVMEDPKGKEIRKEETVNGKSVEIEISPEKTAALSDGEIRVRAEAADAAGNRGNGEIRFILDTVNPVLSGSVNLPVGNPEGIDESSGIVYFGSDPGQYEGGVPVVTASFRVVDQNIGPGDLELRTACKAVPEGQCCEQTRPVWEDAVREEGQITVNESGEGCPGEILLTLQRFPGREDTPDGVYRFGIAGTDKAGNPLVMAGREKEEELPDKGEGNSKTEDELTGFLCENAQQGVFMTGRRMVDTKAPGGELRIENEEGETYCRLSAHDRAWVMDREDFMPYRREENAVIVYQAEDPSPVSVFFRLLSTSGEENDEPPVAEQFAHGNGGRLLIRGGQTFRVEDLLLKDRAGNESARMAETVNFYLDTLAPEADIDAPTAQITAVPQITAHMPDARGLYAGAVALEIYAEDPGRVHGGSGLGEVRCKVRIGGETVREEVLFQGEEDPVYRYHGGITIPSGGQWESNDIEVTVTAEDNAGNRSDPGNGGTLRLGIDTAGPEVTVRYDNNDVRNGRYFDRERTALVTVRERNFDSGKFAVKAPGGVTGEWKRDTVDPDLRTMEVQFRLDGAYTLQIPGTDALGNPAVVSYAGEAAQEFVIDRTPPLIEIVWDNDDVRNGKYYNSPRRAVIRVTDLSFDERSVKILPFSRSFRQVREARDDRTAGTIPVYEAEIPFTQEGEWTLGCLCMDLAGNTAVPVFEETFIIDRTAPRLYFDEDTVQEMGAYGEEITPVLRCEEENPAPGSLCARWSSLTAGGRVMECRSGSEGEGILKAVLPDPPQEKAADGMSMLWGTACDLAGNRTMVRRNLCVNRFGSLYDISEDEKTLEMIEAFYTEAEDPFIIAEYNVTPVTERQITLYRNGNAVILEEGEDYTVSEEKSSAGEKYIYTIDPAAYREEGKYSILVESRDETGNYSSSPGRFITGAEYSPSWAVDRTPPTVHIAGAEEGGNKYVAESVQIRLVPSDNVELSGMDIEVTDDRGNVLLSSRIDREELREILARNGGEVPFEMRACGKWQTLKAVAIDGAGNRSAAMEGASGEGYRILVSTNLMVHLYSSGALPAIAFLALILAIHYGYSVYKHTLA